MTSQIFEIDDKALRKQLKALAGEFPREAKQVLMRTARRVATRTRRRLAAEMQIPQKPLRKRVGAFGERGLRVRVWVGLKKSIGLSELRGRALARAIKNSPHRPFEVTFPSGKKALVVRDHRKSRRYRVKGPRLRRDGQRTELPLIEARIRIDGAKALRIAQAEAKSEMTMYMPGELQRRIAVSIKRSESK